MTELSGTSRKELGRGVQPLRKGGFLPAVVYGEQVASLPISVSYKEFERAYREAGESTLVDLSIDGKKYNVLIHDIARDPLRGDFLHADFYAVRMDKVIRTKVSLTFIGESPAVKNDGGVLVKVVQEVEVEALPKDLPHGLSVDLSQLELLESKLTIKNIKTPQGVKIIDDASGVVVIVEAPRTDAELEALKQAPVEEALAEVKTEQETKREVKEAKEKEKAAATEESDGK